MDRIEATDRCARCEYNLVGLRGHAECCPECGLLFGRGYRKPLPKNVIVGISAIVTLLIMCSTWCLYMPAAPGSSVQPLINSPDVGVVVWAACIAIGFFAASVLARRAAVGQRRQYDIASIATATLVVTPWIVLFTLKFF